MKARALLLLVCVGCSEDVFSSEGDDDAAPVDPDSGVAARPRERLSRSPAEDAGTPDVDASDDADANCSPKISAAFCKDECATADGGATCDNPGNGACVAAGGFYAECASPADCAEGDLCAVVGTPVFGGSCPDSLAGGNSGVTFTCATPAYLVTYPNARRACASSTDCADAGACVPRAVVGYPALSGQIVGVCE